MFKKAVTSKPRIASITKHATLSFLWLSITLSLVSAATATQISNSFDFAASTAIKPEILITPGMPNQILQWATVATSSLFAVGVMAVFHGGGAPPEKPEEEEKEAPKAPQTIALPTPWAIDGNYVTSHPPPIYMYPQRI
jgi:hypothetical protein